MQAFVAIKGIFCYFMQKIGRKRWGTRGVMQDSKTELLYEKDLSRAAEILLQGGVVAFPTETVYGLGACIFLERAIQNIFIAKGRPKDNPIIAHISDISQVDHIAHNVPSIFYKLAERFFPGPLTLVVPKSSRVPSIVSAGLSTIAIRMPNNPIALRLIRLVGQPLVAPSANLSGKPSATDFLHVLEDFDGVIPGVIVGKSSEIGIESTVVSLLNYQKKGKIEILRPGSISKEELEEYLQMRISDYEGDKDFPICPGMKYRHYSPDADIFLFQNMEEVVEHCKNHPECKRMILSNEAHPFVDQFIRFPLNSSTLYARLRLADRCHYQEIVILCDPVIRKDVGVMNRIEKAAGVSCVEACSMGVE